MYSAAVWPLWPRSLESISATLGRSHAPASAPVAMATSSNSARAGSTDVAMESVRLTSAHTAPGPAAPTRTISRRLPAPASAACHAPVTPPSVAAMKTTRSPAPTCVTSGATGSSTPMRPRSRTSSASSAAATPAAVARSDRAHSCCSQDLHIAEASERRGARREAQDPTWSWAGPSG